MKKIALLTAVSVLSTVLFSGHAQAVTFTETDDAGETLSTAQVIPSEPLPLESISGTLAGDADLFQIFLTGGQTFSATTVGGANFDTQLFLFNADGFGVYFNDDSSGTQQSTLPASSQFTPTTSGIYYLAVSGFDYNPVNEDGVDIFPNLTDFPVETPLDEILQGVFGPTDLGGESPLSEFDGAILYGDESYIITLTGAQTGAETVPEPSSVLGTLALGACGVGSLLKNKKNKHKPAVL